MVRPALAAATLVTVGLAVPVAHAERALRGSVGAGGSLLTTGSQGDRLRLDVSLDLKPRSRYGVVLAWRAFDVDHRGLAMAGLLFEAAASRPLLVIDLHADVGADLDQVAPLAGGGIRTTLGIIGPLGAVLDAGGYLVLDGVDDSRFQLQTTLALVARW